MRWGRNVVRAGMRGGQGCGESGMRGGRDAGRTGGSGFCFPVILFISRILDTIYVPLGGFHPPWLPIKQDPLSLN